ncbi:MAG: hypothetical protein BWY57_00583 [Betaproteobacteria bacterium ADurb.Bin341]|nr:MAG: hypothetical protein BWY57_00583 [Betaproteobacteria bacterium ADurb.Bin341]
MARKKAVHSAISQPISAIAFFELIMQTMFHRCAMDSCMAPITKQMIIINCVLSVSMTASFIKGLSGLSRMPNHDPVSTPQITVVTLNT